jgi:divalent metal cation (Fe/Co/Zn/Cd) transporter
VDMHIVVGRDRTVEESHGIADAIEEEIRRVLPGSSVITHVEPCAPPCDACPLGHGGEAGDCRSPRR